MTVTSAIFDRRPAHVRTRLTNGKQAFLAADGRSREGRLLLDREQEFAAPFGGIRNATAIVRTRVQSAALISVRLELARSALARGEGGVDANDTVRLANVLSRELAALERLVPIAREPTLAEVLAASAASRQVAA